MIALKKFLKINIIMFVLGILGELLYPYLCDFGCAVALSFVSLQSIKISLILICATMILIILQIVSINNVALKKSYLVIAVAVKFIQNISCLKFIIYCVRDDLRIDCKIGMEQFKIPYHLYNYWKAFIICICFCGILTSLLFLRKLIVVDEEKKLLFALWLLSCIPILDFFVLFCLIVKNNYKEDNKKFFSFKVKKFLYVLDVTAIILAIILLILYKFCCFNAEITYCFFEVLTIGVEYFLIVLLYNYIIWVNDIY